MLTRPIRSTIFRGSIAREILLTTAVLAVLLLWPVLLDFMRNPPWNRPPSARTNATIADMRNIAAALDAFNDDTGRYPTTAEGLDALVMPPDCEGWNGPYLERMLTDKWGTPYRYTCLPAAADWFFELRSAGHDQTFGTRDDIIYQP